MDPAGTPDGSRLVSEGSDQTARVWDAVDGREVFCLRGHQGCVNAVAVTPDGRLILSAAGDYHLGELHDPTVRAWDARTGEPMRTFTGHSGAVFGVAASPDGSAVASCGWDGAVRVWDLATGAERCRGERTKPPAPFNAVAFSPDGRHLLTGEALPLGAVRLWDARTGQEVRQFTSPPRTKTRGVAFSPDGRWAASAHGYFGSRPPGRFQLDNMPRGCIVDGVARVWDVAGGRPVGTFPTAVRFTEDPCP